MDSDRYDYSDDDYSEYESEGSEFGESSEEYSDDYSDSVYSEEDWNKEDRVIEVGHLLKLWNLQMKVKKSGE